MRPPSKLVRRHALVLAVTIICGSCGWEEPAQPGPYAGEPAQVHLITGPTAEAFLTGKFASADVLQAPPPADGPVIVAEGDQGRVLALVLLNGLEDPQEQLDKLKIFRDVQDCTPGEGDTCCDVKDGKYVIDAELESERFWLRLGESCAPIYREGSTEEDPPEERGADFVEVHPDLMRELKRDYGVTHRYMTLAQVGGEGRVLVDPDPLAQSGELWLPAMMLRPGLQERSPLILADHFDPPAPPPLDQTSNVKYCKLDEGDRCNAEWHYASVPHMKRRHHWYRWWDGDRRWHEMGDNCKCRCKGEDDPVPACD